MRPAVYRDDVEPIAARMQSSLGNDAFEEALSEGGALSLEEAVAYARRGRGSHSRARLGWESLTPSEFRLVSLVGEHMTNAEIAARLFVSIATVKVT